MWGSLFNFSFPCLGQECLYINDPTDVGGVLIDKAATLVGSNLSDIKGATFDPVTKQIVFLGSNNAPSGSLPGIDMDYFYTAIQAVYGSATPPYVTLNTPTDFVPTWVNFSNSADGVVLKPNQTGGFNMNYRPNWPSVDSRIVVHLQAHDTSGHYYDLNYNFQVAYSTAYHLPGSSTLSPMLLTYSTTTSNNGLGAPSGLILDTSPFTQTSLLMSPPQPTFNPPQQSQYQNVTYPLRFYNNTGGNLTVDNIFVVPDRQHRVYGGRVDGTKLGWVMYEADRVMKCLAIGKDDLTGATYSSTSGNVNISGYKNSIELAQSLGLTRSSARLWFEPNQMTLQSYVDPASGQATVNFSASTVQLLTESKLQGQTSNAVDTAFANFFTANYDAFAGKNFTVLDPTDPAGLRTVSLPIFSMLKQAMQAVSLARFFHDNNIPLDKWWMSSYQPPAAYTTKSAPTAFNSSSDATILYFGGIQINKANIYNPSASAQTLGQTVRTARPAPASGDPQDVPGQVWPVSGTSQGNLTAVSASLSHNAQDGNVNLKETDLSFDSPGELPLQFQRFYQSSWLGASTLGPGWRAVRYSLQFSAPSWFDENHLLTTPSIATAANGDTYLHAGAIRVVDAATGGYTDFQSSAQLVNSSDSLGNPTVSISGLNASNLPTFAPGQRQSGATLSQNSSHNYVVGLADGSSLTFDPNGNLLQTTDRHGKTQTLGYDTQGRLSTISDSLSTPQTITLAYDANSGLLSSATGPNGKQTSYQYDSGGRLNKVLFKRSSGSSSTYVATQYSYNTSNQLVDVTRIDGSKPVTTTADVKGRSSARKDTRNNTTNFTYTKNGDGSRTTSALDPNSGLGSASKISDTMGRTVSATDTLGHTVGYAYTGNSLQSNKVQLPTPGRPPILIARNSFGQPTQITDQANTGALPVKANYNAANNLTQVLDEAGRAAEMDYTASQNIYKLRRYHNSAAIETTFGYDANDNLHTITDPLGHAWIVQYDNLGRMQSQSDPTGVSVSYDYDSLGRLYHVYLPTTSTPITYLYDDLDRVTTMTTALGTKTYQYDPVTTWVSTVTSTGTDGVVQKVDYSYNTANGDIQSTTLTVPAAGGGTTSTTTGYSYTGYGNLQAVTPPGAKPINFNYNAAGQLLATSETNAGPTVGPSIVASNATGGTWTNQRNQTFTFGPPESSLPITGYNYAEDASTTLTVNTTGNTVAWNAVADGQHTLRARAVDSSGLWSPETVFNLWVDATAPAISNVSASPNPVPQSPGVVTISATVSDALSGLAGGYPKVRWCISADATRNWSAYTSMASTGTNQWTSTVSQNGAQASGQVFYFEIQAQDVAGNVAGNSGSVAMTYTGGGAGVYVMPLAGLAGLLLLIFLTANRFLPRKSFPLPHHARAT